MRTALVELLVDSQHVYFYTAKVWTYIIVLGDLDIEDEIPDFLALSPRGIRRALRALYADNHIAHDFEFAPVDAFFAYHATGRGFLAADALGAGAGKYGASGVRAERGGNGFGSDKSAASFGGGDEIASVEWDVWDSLAGAVFPC